MGIAEDGGDTNGAVVKGYSVCENLSVCTCIRVLTTAPTASLPGLTAISKMSCV